MKKNVAILGSTGSIGTQTLEVVESHFDEFNIVGLSAGENIELLKKQIKKFSPKIVSVNSKELADKLRNDISNNIIIVYGEKGLIDVATYNGVDFVVVAVVGSIGLSPTIEAIKASKNIGLANKETLVSGGHIVMDLVKQYNVELLPIDSEHSAIFQCLKGETIEKVNKIILTASGGSFRDKSRKELKEVTVEEALKHPNWSMGNKITIDSATMMNKGLEVIEAHWLFSLPYEKIEVIVHPESIIHSMVEYNDKAVIAQLGTPDMKVPIQYALSYPDRLELESKSLDLSAIGSLNFKKPDLTRFPCLKMAYQCGIQGGTMTTVLNAANEIAVNAFLTGEILFIEIEEVIEKVLDKHNNTNKPTIEEITISDKWARMTALNIIDLIRR